MTHQLCTICVGAQPTWLAEYRENIKDHKYQEGAGVLINGLFVCEAHAKAIAAAHIHRGDCWGQDDECRKEGCV